MCGAILAASYLPILRADYGEDNPTGVAGEFNGQVTSGCSYDPYTGNAKRSITDIVVPGAVGAYPLAFTRTMNSRIANSDSLDYPFGKAGSWRHNYQWEIQSQSVWGDLCNPDLSYPAEYVVTYPDGQKVTFLPDGSNFYRSIMPGIGDRFSPINNGPDPDGYLRRRDGGKIRFHVERSSPVPPYNCDSGSNYGYIAFAYTCTGILDPYAQETTIARTGTTDNPIYTITEPAGRNLTIVYVNSLIDRVEERAITSDPPAPSGRMVKYNYTGSGETTALDNVVYFGDQLLTARYRYQPSNFPTNPPNPALIGSCDDPMYVGAMSKIGYVFAPSGPHGFLQSENYFDGNVGAPVSTLSVTGTNTRREDRGDGPSRTFTYSGGLLINWTDFKNIGSSQGHFTSGAIGFVSYVIDAKRQQTDFARNSITGNVTQVTYPLTPPDTVRSAVVTAYNPGSEPYYVISVTNERQYPISYIRPDGNNNQVSDINYPDLAHEGFLYNDFGQVTWHQRKNGFWEEFDYDSRGRLINIWLPVAGATQPNSNAPKTTFTYYPLGDVWQDRVQSFTDPRGKTTSYEYDISGTNRVSGRGLISRIIYNDDNNRYLSFGYDARGNMLWQENELRQRISYLPDDYNRRITVTTPLPNSSDGATTSYAYNPIHDPNVPLSPYLHTTQAVTRITTPATLVNPSGIVTVNRYDENFHLSQTTLGAGTSEAATTYYGVDFNGNLNSVIERNHETTIDYDERNRRITVTGPTLSPGTTQYVTRWLYDPASNVRNISLPDLATQITQDYDEMNRLKTNDLLTYTPAETHRITHYTYWPSGRLKTLKDPRDKETAFEYNERDLKNKMTYPGGGTPLEGWFYDGDGNMTERPTIGGPTQSFTYDSRNRLKTMRWNSGVPDFSDFDYDEAGRLKSALNPYSSITREYDVGGRLKFDRQVLASTLNTPPLTITPIGVVSRKTHGSAGDFDIDLPLSGDPGIECRNGPNYTLVLTFADPITVGGATVNSGIGSVASTTASGNVVTVNLLGVSNAQLLTVRVFGLNDGTNTGELTVPMHVLISATTGHPVVNSADSQQTSTRQGQVTDATNFRSDVISDGVINSADLMRVLLSAGTDVPVAPAPGPQADVSYNYYDDGRLRDLFVPATDYYYNFAYDYDGMGRLKTVSENTQPAVRYYQYSYDASSNVIGRTSHTSATRDISLSFVPDELNRITEETILLGGNALFSHLHYTYDPMSRLISTLRDEENLLDSFGYNFAGELNFPQYGLQPDGHGGWGNPASATTYVYDNAGNRESVNGVPYTPNDLNQYEGATIHNGSQHEIDLYQGVNYSYLADTQLAVVSSTSDNYKLGYDALGRTVKRTTNNVPSYFIYDGPHPILEYDVYGRMTGSTLYGLGMDEILARNNNGDGQFLLQDLTGSTVALTSSSGDLLEKYRYDAFGKPKIMNPSGTPIPDSAFNNRFLFTGREWVSRFGFYEYRARAYHPELGRFMSEDPMGFAAGDANLYRYCGNDPVNSIDPTGMFGMLAIYANRGTNYYDNTGHSWISYTPNSTGVTTTYGTFSNLTDRPNGVAINVDGTHADAVRSQLIGNVGEASLFRYIAAMQALGADAWHWYSPCSTFAANAWNLATGENLGDRDVRGIHTPTALADSIDKANGRGLAYFFLNFSAYPDLTEAVSEAVVAIAAEASVSGPGYGFVTIIRDDGTQTVIAGGSVGGPHYTSGFNVSPGALSGPALEAWQNTIFGIPGGGGQPGEGSHPISWENR